MEHQEKSLAEGLRELADWLDGNPGIVPDADWVDVTLHVPLDTRDELVEAARALGGKREKDAVGDYFTVRRRFGPRVSLDFFCPRGQVCERRVVGYRDVPARREEIVEWECEDAVLLGSTA